MSQLCNIITSTQESERNRALTAVCSAMTVTQLVAEIEALEVFRHEQTNLYFRVRALFFLYAIHRFILPPHYDAAEAHTIPYEGYLHLLNRRFEEAIHVFLAGFRMQPSDAVSSALAQTYHQLAFQTLADQVRQSVRAVRGNQWMFRMGHPADFPLRIRSELRERDADGLFPFVFESTPVRMDISHSAWSDIFFLGMDYPAGAQVLNISVDLGVHTRDTTPKPPVEAYVRVIDEPVLRLTSVDLGSTADITNVAEVFDFGRDYLGLLKAAVIAAGIVPPGMEHSNTSLADLLAKLVGAGNGLELISSVNDIPKGSRLAVSTNLLAALISVCMRATGQTASLTGSLAEEERRLVAARAILGEWLAGSGGGWQDSGGVWPGIKFIHGAEAGPDDPEYGISRGRLLPQHVILDTTVVSTQTRQKLQNSLVLVHGGMAQNVGPILEMVTEKYLLREAAEWGARQDAIRYMEEVRAALAAGNIRALGAITTRNFYGPIQTIIPWATTRYTEGLIRAVRARFGDAFWGFWMLGGMSGGGMGFIVDPAVKADAQRALQEIMDAERAALQDALPFAMKPVVYDFAVNERGTWSTLCTTHTHLLPTGYYALHMPRLLRTDPKQINPTRRLELDRFGAACLTRPELARVVPMLFDQMLPHVNTASSYGTSLSDGLVAHGFDRELHEQIRGDMQSGRIGLLQNRLPASASIRDVLSTDVVSATGFITSEAIRLGEQALRLGEVAVVTLAGGAGSRWTQGAGVVKPLHPFAQFAGRHRTFVDVHIAKSRKTSQSYGNSPTHVFTTSYLTHRPLQSAFSRNMVDGRAFAYPGEMMLSHGRSVGQRFVPMTRDLHFAWEETPHQLLDVQAQKMRESVHNALLEWARETGEGADYTDNTPLQCMHPIGHWFELPNMFRNGVFAELLRNSPNIKYLMLHNIDTLGASLDPGMLGVHIQQNRALSFEVIARRLDDRGGGLARVDNHVRLVEGLAMPRIEAEFQLRYYNTLTNWIDIDQLLAIFELCRDDIHARPDRVSDAVRAMAQRMPTYVTIKDVKKRWGNGQEDVYPVAQFEKLWGDMTALPGAHSAFFHVSRARGQQLKDQAQLDGWLRDGSAAAIDALCAWPEE